jgi:hypothetical protein
MLTSVLVTLSQLSNSNKCSPKMNLHCLFTHQRRQLQCSLSLALQSINARSLLLPRSKMKIVQGSRHRKRFSDGLLSRF